MMSRRFKARLRRRRPVGMLSDLNLTSLTDMFAFILVFLLKHYSVSNVALKPPVGMVLPQSISAELPQRNLVIDVQRHGIFIENQLVQQLENFAVTAPSDQYDTLFVMRTLLKQKLESGAIQSTVAVIRADRDAPFDIIWRVMFTARQLGFEEFQNLAQQEAHSKKI